MECPFYNFRIEKSINNVTEWNQEIERIIKNRKEHLKCCISYCLSQADKRENYLRPRDGKPGKGNSTVRKEELLSAAIWSEGEINVDGYKENPLKMIRYQFPIKKLYCHCREIDLFGITSKREIVVFELKLSRDRLSKQATPLLAILEGLNYMIAVIKNREQIKKEIKEERCEEIKLSVPKLFIAAPDEYWEHWESGKSGKKQYEEHKLQIPKMRELVNEIKKVVLEVIVEKDINEIENLEIFFLKLGRNEIWKENKKPQVTDRFKPKIYKTF